MTTTEIRLEIDDIAPRLAVLLIDQMKTMTLDQLCQLRKQMSVNINISPSKGLTAKNACAIFAVIGGAYVSALQAAREKEAAHAVENPVDR